MELGACHANGFQVEQTVDQTTGEVQDYGGFFIYVDRETLHTIEDVSGFILDLMDEQKKGSLPYDYYFYGIQSVQYLVNCLYVPTKIIMSGMLEQCLHSLETE
jgi:hypothetical protein